MPTITLIRNSNPQRNEELPASKWGLSIAGKLLIPRYIEALKPYKFNRIISSHEQKAIETAELIAKELSVPSDSAYDLQEADRENVPYIESKEIFSALIEEIFLCQMNIFLVKNLQMMP